MASLTNSNFRPLIFHKEDIEGILNYSGYYEIAFYLSYDKIGRTENGIYTLRYALIDKNENIINFNGKKVSKRFKTALFKNSKIKIKLSVSANGVIESDSGIWIGRKPGEAYILDRLLTNLNAVGNDFNGVVIYVQKESNSQLYELKFSYFSFFGGIGGPGGTINKPPK